MTDELPPKHPQPDPQDDLDVDSWDRPPQDEPPSERLAFLSDRQIAAANPLYSKGVRALRLILPVAALAIIAVVVAWPQMDRLRPALPEKKAGQAPVSHNELLKPRFMGQDENNQPYELTAVRAVQDAGDPDLLLLDHPQGQAAMSDGTGIQAKAVEGFYRQKAQNLILRQTVDIRTDSGYVLTADILSFDLSKRRIWSDQPVEGEGPAGKIQAAGMKADRDTGVLVFTGPARLVLTKAFREMP